MKNLKISFWPRGQHLEVEGAKLEGVFPVNRLRRTARTRCTLIYNLPLTHEYLMIAERRKLDPVKAAVCVCAMDVSDANQVLVCLDLYAHGRHSVL